MPEFIRAIGIYYRSELNAIKKSGVQLQPVYEAFSNAWESIIERFSKEKLRHGKIRMEFHYTMGLFQDDAENQTAALDKIIIIDNGVGINPASYNRLLTLRDNSKSASKKVQEEFNLRTTLMKQLLIVCIPLMSIMENIL